MSFENPFLLREYRQVLRRPSTVLLGLLAAVVVPGFFFLLVFYLAKPGSLLRPYNPALIWPMLLTHTVVCGLAGGYGADRIFGEEHRRSTLGGLRMAHIPAPKWLALRICYPICLVLLAWVAAFPVYLLAVVVRLAPFSQVTGLALIPPLGGLLAIPLLLLLPPDYAERMRQARMRAGHTRHKADPDLTVRWFILSMLGMLFQFGFIFGLITSPLASRSLYGLVLPGWVLLAAALAGLLATSFVTAAATLTEEKDAERWAFRVRVVYLTLLYYLLLGLFHGAMWSRLAEWGRWLPIVGYPVFMYYLLRVRTRPKEDPLSGAEVRWFSDRTPNPLLEKDLRVYTRFTSIRRYILMELLGMAAITIGAIYLFVVRLGASLSSTLLALCLLAAALSVMVLLIEMAARPYGTWTRERTANTLILLFLTPLSSREILRGRLVGGLLYALNAHVPLLLAGACGIIWITLRGAWMVLPFLLALSPLAALFAVVLASTIRPQVGAPWTWRLDEWLEVVLSIGQVVILFVAIVVLANLYGTSQALTWLSALGFFAVNTAIVWACYLIRVRQFETLRCGEREVPLR